MYPLVEDGHDRVVFDLDGVLAENTWPNPDIGAPIAAALQMAEHFAKQGKELVVYTARPRSHRARIWSWLSDTGLPWYYVICGKPVAGLYIDDRAVRFPLASAAVVDLVAGVIDHERGHGLIGITGHLRAGKDSVAGYLLEMYPGAKIERFSGPLKALALAIDPIVLPVLAERLSTMVSARGWEDAKEFPEVRRLLQKLGTEAGREILGADIWVDLMDRRVFGEGSELEFTAVIPDVRFPNEAQWVIDNGGTMIRVDRPGFKGDGHDSECFVDGLFVDIVIDNSGTLSDLEMRTKGAAVLTRGARADGEEGRGTHEEP